MKKERIRLETLEIPDIPEDDIVEVITNVKELLQKRAVKKYESSILTVSYTHLTLPTNSLV